MFTLLLFWSFFCLSRSQQLITETFISEAVTLHPGQIANTDPLSFPLLEWPHKPIAIRYFDSEVIDDSGNAVALYDLYIHHYLIYVNSGKFNAGPCGIHNVWGIGAEMRGTVYEYPAPYGVIFDGTENMTVNLHFIRTDTVNNENHQKCIECHCSDGTPTNPDGSIRCCENEAFCWGMPWTDQDPKNYYLKYTIKYTEDIESVLPITAYTYDVTSEDNFDCTVEYQVSEQSVSNGWVNIRRSRTTVFQDTDIVLVEIHQHIGGLNYTVEHWRDGDYIGILCQATPVYGSGTEVGNENEYVVKIPTCQFNEETVYHVEKDDELRLTSIYNGRHIVGGSDYHEGVMGLLLYWGVRTGPSTCEAKLKEVCGDPLPKTTQACYQCFTNYMQSLYYADCGADYGWPLITFLCKTDNGVKSPYPINSTQIQMENIMIDEQMRENLKSVNFSNITMPFNGPSGRFNMVEF